MAKLNEETKATVLNLVGQLLDWIDESKTVEMAIFETYGENDATMTVLDELKNYAESLINSYSRFYTLLLRITEAQPHASFAMINLLTQTIDQSRVSIDTIQQTIKVIRRNFNL